MQRLLIDFLSFPPSSGALRLQQICQPQLFHLLSKGRVLQLQIVVGIIAAQGGHGQNFTGLYIHHDAESAVLHRIAFDGLLHLVFKARLHGHIQRQNHIISRLRGQVILIGEGHIHLVIALGGDHFPHLPLQIAVIGGLNTL